MHEDTRAGSALWALLVVSLIVVACATVGTPSVELASGSESVAAARGAGAAEYAPDEVSRADAKLQRARELAQQGQNLESRRLAEEAAVEADVARAKASAERSRRALAQAQDRLVRERARLGSPEPVSNRIQ
jgi:multidrug resistance efflux pump